MEYCIEWGFAFGLCNRRREKSLTSLHLAFFAQPRVWDQQTRGLARIAFCSVLKRCLRSKEPMATRLARFAWTMGFRVPAPSDRVRFDPLNLIIGISANWCEMSFGQRDHGRFELERRSVKQTNVAVELDSLWFWNVFPGPTFHSIRDTGLAYRTLDVFKYISPAATEEFSGWRRK
ncbi:hypothetical protein BJY00DRAFT_285420 [Aspergillus carlsbadensis]|nr:hypothetical protein BJY00DRAFT_285420 [Aspergillus carlsbadensis]